MHEFHILVVEDNERNAKLVCDVLGVVGYRVTHTETAEAALEVVRADRPDLVLMDIQLPGMSGTEALAQLKQTPATRSVPVIAVSASVMPMERDEILAAGFDGFQAKPISVKDLLREVESLLGNGAVAQP